MLAGQLKVYAQHNGHDPSAPHEVYHLKVHPNVIKCCMDDLFDIGCARHVARISMRKALIDLRFINVKRE